MKLYIFVKHSIKLVLKYLELIENLKILSITKSLFLILFLLLTKKLRKIKRSINYLI